ncbi:hypothetical protein [Lysinibacillus capsici]|uniref:hypothetical protein n=1 Tax=Lysinibacillus capsici TaxID=2115968 RepID=UPI001CD9A317|nr:hypothetical protein [Lysinibacillus capsici]
MAFVTTIVSGYSLSVEYKNGVVSIKNNKALINLLKNESSAPLQAAAVIKAEYKKRIGRNLDISTGSFGVEILGHVYPDRIRNAIKLLPLSVLIENAMANFLKPTEVIDCGEPGKYGDRFFLDFLYSTASSLIID